MTRRIFLATAIIFLLAFPACAGLQTQSWQYNKQVQPVNDGFALIDLDQEVLRHTRDDLADIRLSDGEGQEVPYQILQPEPDQEKTYPAQLIDKVVRPNEFSSVTLDVQNGNNLHNRIVLDLESKEDYLRDVKIEGSEDNRTWNLVGTVKVFCVYPNNRQNDLNYFPASFRYMKVSIDCRGKEPLTIRDARIKYVRPDVQSLVQNSSIKYKGPDPSGGRPEITVPATLITNRTDPKTNKTELLLDLGTKGYEINHIDLQVNGINFDRLVEYYDSNDGSNWNRIGSERIYQHKWTDYEALKNKLTVNRNMGRYVKLAVNNQDNPPLNVESVVVWGDSPKILADLRTGSYTLWYGNPDGKAPQYDLSHFSQLIDKNKLAVIQPGQESINANYHPKLTDNRWVLNTVTIIAALVIGLLILKNMKAKA
ncbi:DUF3999 domain-containing protein [Pelotomaculum isophthalicicum JI]|uniref:DUF3999 domain-containing protein n=1 Tax=Pelotomaculum isophthalicicum JI TaxID=947010 RepID=A0A9X4H5E7_9FIRM|nr:hypothetical protein [Pelotomaculum isophthalicicum]MDF9408417.1 DUF3999 domain-containing protein [Pelotomaculum isophthalicicum JI]